MSQKALSLKNILWGILLGLTITAGWFFYPNILHFFKSSTMQIAEKPKIVTQDELDTEDISSLPGEDTLAPTPISTKSNEAQEPPIAPEPDSKEEEGTDDAEEDRVDEPVSQEVMSGPSEKKTMYPFWEFDDRDTAESFMANIKERSGVELWLGQEGHRYIVYIPAMDEKEKNKKAALIKKETGIVGK